MGTLTTKEINIIGTEIANGVEYSKSEIPDSDEKLQVWIGLKADYLRAKASGKPMKIPNELDDDDGWYLAAASQTPEEMEQALAAKQREAQERVDRAGDGGGTAS